MVCFRANSASAGSSRIVFENHENILKLPPSSYKHTSKKTGMRFVANKSEKKSFESVFSVLSCFSRRMQKTRQRADFEPLKRASIWSQLNTGGARRAPNPELMCTRRSYTTLWSWRSYGRSCLISSLPGMLSSSLVAAPTYRVRAGGS